MPTEKKPINLTGDVTPVAEGMKTNLDALPKGTNKLFQTFFGKKYADSTRYKMLLAAQTEADMSKITSGEAAFIDGELVPLPKERLELASASFDQLLQIKQKEETENLAGCMREAIKDSLAQPEEASDTLIGEKFFSRWRNEAIHISDQDEQMLWGKVLSEENQKEGSFSLSTLDVLRNIDKKSAEIFVEICKNVVFECYIVLNDNYGVSEEITTSVILRLAELGLLTISVPIQTYNKLPTMDFDGKEVFFLNVEPYLVLIDKEKNEDELSILYANLTNAGKEIRKVAAVVNEESISNLCSFILNANNFNKFKSVSYGKYKFPIEKRIFEIGELTCITRDKSSEVTSI